MGRMMQAELGELELLDRQQLELRHRVHFYRATLSSPQEHEMRELGYDVTASTQEHHCGYCCLKHGLVYKMFFAMIHLMKK